MIWSDAIPLNLCPNGLQNYAQDPWNPLWRALSFKYELPWIEPANPPPMMSPLNMLLAKVWIFLSVPTLSKAWYPGIRIEWSSVACKSHTLINNFKDMSQNSLYTNLVMQIMWRNWQETRHWPFKMWARLRVQSPKPRAQWHSLLTQIAKIEVFVCGEV